MSSNSVTAGFKRLVEGDGAAKKILTAGLAEIIGTAILLFLGCTGCVSGLGVIPSHLQISLTFGLTVMVVIQCIGHLSEAHINPAMTVGSVILGRKTIAEAVIYIVSQLIGAVIGYGLIKVVTPEDRLSLGTGDETKFCVTDLHMDISPSQGLLLEVIATGILMFVACAVWDQRNAKNSDSVAIKFGLTVTVLAATVGPYTGCSMNPVRSFAPALWNNQWHHQWIYLFGPIGGAIFSSVVYRTLFGVEEESENILENVALNSIGTHKSEQM